MLCIIFYVVLISVCVCRHEEEGALKQRVSNNYQGNNHQEHGRIESADSNAAFDGIDTALHDGFIINSQIIIAICIGGTLALFISITTVSCIAIGRQNPPQTGFWSLDFSSDEFIERHRRKMNSVKNASSSKCNHNQKSDFVLNALNEINQKDRGSSIDEKINKLYSIVHNVNSNNSQ